MSAYERASCYTSEGKHHTCLERYLDFFHLYEGKSMENARGPINHTKLLRESGFKSTK
jgi:hypothetical protein